MIGFYELCATPFHARAVEANRLNAWENRGRFTLATHYGDVAEEALAARFGAAIADLSWHWRIEISGDKAPAFVARLFTRDASALGNGAAMDVLWLNDAGAVRGQGTAIRLDAGRFLLDAAIEDTAWIESAARLYGVKIEDRTETDGVVALIGPAAAKILNAAGIETGQPPHTFRRTHWRGLEISLMRGPLGFCIGCAADDGLVVWDRLMAAGRPFALLPAGQAALDILETESGIIRPLRDYTPASEGFAPNPSPQSLGLMALVDRAHLFNGRAGVLAAGPDTRLQGLLLEGDLLAPGTPVIQGAAAVGQTLGARYSPALKRAIAFAVLPDLPVAGPLTAAGCQTRAVDLPFLSVPAATEAAAATV